MDLLLIFLLATGCTSTNASDKKVINEIHPDDITEIGFFQAGVDSIGKWIIPPDIEICKDANVTKEQVKSAATWWQTRNYAFDKIYDNVEKGPCIGQSRFTYYAIVIRLPGQAYNFENYGSTIIYHENKKILGVVIEISEARERVLEHELGHALGWLHYSKRSHLMHPFWSKGGWNDDGLTAVEVDLSTQAPQID